MLSDRTFYAGPQAANAANHQVDLNTGLAGAVECVDDFVIDERIHLHPDLRRPAFLGVLDFCFGQFQHPLAPD